AAFAGLLLAGGRVSPLSAFATGRAARPPYGITLDGSAYLNQDDRSAVRWLIDQQRQAGGRIVIAEAAGDEYSSGSRMATYSGASTVIGWVGHELQWRGPIAELGRREGDLHGVYHDAPAVGISPLLHRYHVPFVLVGDIERQKYGDEVATRFDGILPVAFRSGGVTIYRARQ